MAIVPAGDWSGGQVRRKEAQVKGEQKVCVNQVEEWHRHIVQQ